MRNYQWQILVYPQQGTALTLQLFSQRHFASRALPPALDGPSLNALHPFVHVKGDETKLYMKECRVSLPGSLVSNAAGI